MCLRSTYNVHERFIAAFTLFEKLGFNNNTFIPEADREYAADVKNWNSVANLQLLNETMNESKNDSPLVEWVTKNNIDKKTLYVNDATSLDIKDFKSFIIDRKKHSKGISKEHCGFKLVFRLNFVLSVIIVITEEILILMRKKFI